MSRISRIKKAGEYLRDHKDNDGKIAIDVNLSPSFEVYEPLSVGYDNELNSNIYDYIEEKANLIPSNIPLKIRFHGRSFSEEEQENISKIMKRHYNVATFDKEWDKAANTKTLISRLNLTGNFLKVISSCKGSEQSGLLWHRISIINF